MKKNKMLIICTVDYAIFVSITDQSMIKVYYTKIAITPSKKLLEYALQLPERLRLQAEKFKVLHDKLAYISGKLLLKKGLADFGITASLNDYYLDNHGRPFVSPEIDFNISHSGEYVLCAISNEGSIGIDIELQREIDISLMRKYFSEKEWNNIIQDNSNQINQQFFDHWTMKEAVLKANGRGLTINPIDVCLSGNKATLKSVTWHLIPITLFIGYSAFIAIGKETDQVHFPEFVANIF